jgi:hypothetical protein
MLLTLLTMSQADTGDTGLSGPLPLVEADAGIDFMAYVGQTIELNGDGDGDGELTYSWARVEGPPAELTAADTPNPRFTPEREGTYTFELVVQSGSEASLPDEIRVVIVRTDVNAVVPTGDLGLCSTAPLAGLMASLLGFGVAASRRRR